MDPSADAASTSSQPDSFVAPEGLYSLSPTHFLSTYIPQPVSPGTVPVLPVRLNLVKLLYPPRRDGTSGLGGLLGMSGAGGNGGAAGSSVGGASGKDQQHQQQAAAGLVASNSLSYEPSLSSSSEGPSANSSDNHTSSAQSPVAASSDLSNSFPSSLTTNTTTSSSVPSRNFLGSSTRAAAAAAVAAVSTTVNSNSTSGQQALPKPKNNIRSTSSSFVTRIQSVDNLTRVLAERARMGDPGVTWALWNFGRVLGWVEIGGRVKEPLARITFSSAITCHAVQKLSSSGDRLDVLIGFVTGDIVWFEPISGRYTRMNKLGVIHPSAVLAILPHPTSPLLFYVIHQDGHIFTYSLERDDPVLAPGTTAPWTGLVAPTADWHSANPDQPGLAFWRNPPPARESEKEKDKTRIIGRNPVAVWRVDAGLTGRQTGGQRKKAEHNSGGAAGGGGDGLGGVPMANGAGSGSTTGVGGQASAPSTPVTTTGPSAAGGGGSGNTANPTYNFAPTTMDPRGLTAASLSPDGKLLALAGDDGLLRIVDIGLERLTDVYTSYFGGLTCLAWSPDSRFLLSGGQDDLVTILAPRDRGLVARCQGHTSFLTGLAWDWARCDSVKGRYRFGSVGEDGKVLLWDFSPALLQRPRHHTSSHHHHHHHHHRNSIASTTSFTHQLRRLMTNTSEHHHHHHHHHHASSSHLPLHSGTRYHSVPPRAEVALLQAVMTKATDPGILTELHFIDDALCTVSRAAQVRFFARPAGKSLAGGLFASPSGRVESASVGSGSGGGSGAMLGGLSRGLGIKRSSTRGSTSVGA